MLLRVNLSAKHTSIIVDIHNVYLDHITAHAVYLVSDKMTNAITISSCFNSGKVLAIMIARLVIFVVLISSIISLDTSQKAREQSEKSKSMPSWQPPRQAMWLCFTKSNLTNNTIDCCQFYEGIKCLENGPALPYGYCVTYSEDNYTQSLTIVRLCSYLQSNIVHYNVTTYQYHKFISLPVSLSELNDYMCGPLNRKGTVCSQCATGYGPSVISDRYECAKCTHLWYGVFVYIMVEFIPITVLYFITLVFRISVTTPPMPCFILYAQMVSIGLRLTLSSGESGKLLSRLLQNEEGRIRLDMKIIDTFYGLFSLQNTLRYLLDPLCISHNIKFIHVLFFGYLTSFYPILLICVTVIFIKLHDNNFRPVVLAWRPFHKCFTRLHRGWDTKSDIIDVFTAFFFLSCSKCLYISYVLLGQAHEHTMTSSGENSMQIVLAHDMTVPYLSKTHVVLATVSLGTSLIYYMVPSLLLSLYPFKCFKLILTRCHTDLVAVKIFVDKIQSHYRNGLDGGKDMRSFSSLYLYMRFGAFVTAAGVKATHLSHNSLYIFGLIILCTAVLMALVRPYQNDSMNNIDTLLLSNLSLFCFAMSSGQFVFARVLLFIPMVMFIGTLAFKSLQRLIKLHFCRFMKVFCGKCGKFVHCHCRYCFKLSPATARDHSIDTAVAPSATQPLIQPTSTEVSYDSCTICE